MPRSGAAGGHAPGGCPAGCRHTSNPGVGGLPRGLCSLCLKGRTPWGTNASDEVFYSSPGQEKAGVHSGTDDRRKIAQDISFFLLSIQPAHPRVCPDTSRGADTVVSEVGNLQEEASGLPQTETTKLTPALRSDSAMCHLPGVPPSHVARDTPGCDNVLTRPTIFGDSLCLLLLLSLPQLLPRAVPNSIQPLPQEPPLLSALRDPQIVAWRAGTASPLCLP